MNDPFEQHDTIELLRAVTKPGQRFVLRKPVEQQWYPYHFTTNLSDSGLLDFSVTNISVDAQGFLTLDVEDHRLSGPTREIRITVVGRKRPTTSPSSSDRVSRVQASDCQLFNARTFDGATCPRPEVSGVSKCVLSCTDFRPRRTENPCVLAEDCAYHEKGPPPGCRPPVAYHTEHRPWSSLESTLTCPFWCSLFRVRRSGTTP